MNKEDGPTTFGEIEKRGGRERDSRSLNAKGTQREWKKEERDMLKEKEIGKYLQFLVKWSKYKPAKGNKLFADNHKSKIAN